MTDDAAETRLGAAPVPTSPAPGGELAPGAAFGLRYSIIQQLGAGGMGVVYKAWDDVLGVVVALKMIRLDATHDAAAIADVERRFKRELLLAREVTHKNVVRIHDLGDVSGTKYITMTYVDGQDLSTVLKREGRLPVDRVMRLARQIASGLEAAHDAGVVHRDLKPANIMVDAHDNALIMDFGVAVSTAAQASAAAGGTAAPIEVPPPVAGDEATRLGPPSVAEDATRMGPPSAAGDATSTRSVATTFPSRGSGSGSKSRGSGGSSGSSGQRVSAAESITIGQIVGTLEYMSPEQSRGEPVDQRSDIYAFGLILRDLLLGRRKRGDGVSAWDAMSARITKAPQSLAAEDAAIPAALDAIVVKCLQLRAPDRFATTHDLVAALARLDDHGVLIPEPVTKRMTPLMKAGAAVGVLVLVGGTYWLARANAPVEHKPVSVLIADFTNTTNEPAFSSTVEQALTVGVESASFITAFPHRDALRIANEIKASTLNDQAARLIAMREGLAVIIGGSIAAKNGGYVLTVKATNVADQKVVLDWNTAVADKDQMLAAVGRAAERVRRTLGDSNTANAASEQETFTAASLDAAKVYAEAQDFQWAGKNDEAIDAYQRALKIDPNFGRAYSGLAALFANRGRNDEAEVSYQRALSLLDRMTEREKLRTRGGYYLFKRYYDKASAEFEALLQKYPNDTSGAANLALAQFYRRDMKTALATGKRASDQFPNNVLQKNNAALYAMYAGDFDEATRLARKVLEVNPTYVKGFVALGLSQLAQGHAEDAVATYNKLAVVDSATAKGFAASGLIDVALLQHRDADALTLLTDAIGVDRTAKNQRSLGRRLALRAILLAAKGDKAGAVRDATEAVTLGNDESIVYPAGRALIAAGHSATAIELAAELDNRLENEPRLYGAILRGDAALASGRARAAVNAYQDAIKLGDAWLARLQLGRAYLALKAYPEASAELDRCVSRRGEATAIFLDDRPSYHYFGDVAALADQAKSGLAGK